MQTDVLSANPHEPLAETLVPLLQSATRLELAVAFMTRYGVDLLLNNVHLPNDDVTVVVSVRTPTDLDAVQDIFRQWPNRVWIDLGFETPTERVARLQAQLHSKLVIVQSRLGQVQAVIGSHNWTRMALTGRNGEVSVRLTGTDADVEIQDLRQHVVTLRQAETCERFDPARMDFYKAIQNQQATENIDYVERPVLVVRAEAATAAAGYPDRLVTFIPSNNSGVSNLSTTTSVHFYLYDPGDLHRPGGRPLRPPFFYEGAISMVNNANNGGVADRPVTAVIQTRAAPVVHLTPILPVGHGCEYEVVFDVERRVHRPQSPRLYYGWGKKPTVKDVLLTVEATDPGRDVEVKQDVARPYTWWGKGWTRPARIERVFSVTVPFAEEVYSDDPYEIAECLLRSRRSPQENQNDIIRVARPPAHALRLSREDTQAENAFWFRVGGWLNEDK